MGVQRTMIKIKRYQTVTEYTAKIYIYMYCGTRTSINAEARMYELYATCTQRNRNENCSRQSRGMFWIFFLT